MMERSKKKKKRVEKREGGHIYLYKKTRYESKSGSHLFGLQMRRETRVEESLLQVGKQVALWLDLVS